MRNKLGTGVLCLLLSAVIYAAAKGDLNSAASAVADSMSNVRAAFVAHTMTAAVAPDQPIESLASELPAHDPTVGKLAGSASTSGGAAGYSIPIALPPGRRGMQPSLSLDYSSRAGNGIAGMGWSLSGLSSLHRCPSTLDQDNSVRAVALTNGDKLCLDGQRLVATSGTYGTSGAIYDTEIDSFVRVTQLGGNLQSASTYFKVETKDGDILYYGNNSTAPNSARVIPGGVSVPLSWMLAYKSDRIGYTSDTALGNYIHYIYSNYGNGEVLVNSIVYTGFGTTDGDRHVDFSYETRPTSTSSVANDIASSYIAGGLTLQTQRLATVTSYVGTQPVRQYKLRFDAPSAYTGRSLLRGVKDCGFADGSTTAICRPETTFAWQESALQNSFHAFAMPTGLPTNQMMSSIRSLGDLDGDGVPELDAFYSDYSGQTAGSDYLVSLNADKTIRSVVAGVDLGPAFTAGSGFMAKTPVDFNHDGRTDIMSTQIINGSAHVMVTVWKGTTTAFVASAFQTYDLGLAIPQTQACGIETGDVNGDGYTDLLVTTSSSSAGCWSLNGASPVGTQNTLSVYFGVPGSGPGVPAVQSTAGYTLVLPHALRTADGAWLDYYPTMIQDFDGDGLQDVFLTRQADTPANNSSLLLERDKPQMLMFSRLNQGGFTLGGSGNQYNTFAAFGSTSLDADETNAEAWTQIADINGDGLPDLISIKTRADGQAGYWSVRLNNGGHYGPRMVTNSQRGIEKIVCSTDANDHFQWNKCTDRWPVSSSLLDIGDTDHDGHAEILAPRAFAARICVDNTMALSQTNPEIRDIYTCPLDPLTGAPDRFMNIQPPDSNPSMNDGGSDGVFDPSAYFMDSVRFVQNASGGIDVAVVHTPIVHSGIAHRLYANSTTLDVYGTGMSDAIAPIGLAAPPPPPLMHYNSYPAIDPDNPAWGPATLPDGTDIYNAFRNMHWGYYLSEDIGTGFNPDGKTPEQADLMSMATDGLGAQTVWTYYPLSSAAGRTAGQTPLYAIPSNPAQRYIDNANVYFTSSMPVVSDMAMSDGIGGFHSMRYGYGQAMYNTQGRGFQGFRTIIEEDLTAGLRTTTTFNQKFPLVSKVVDVVVNAMTRSGTGAPIRHETYTWLCDRSDRTNTSACTPQNGNAVVKFPFLDEHDTTTYDATVALQSSGTPQQVGSVRDVNANDPSCAGTAFSTASGFDAYGNLTGHTVLSSDTGTGWAGLRAFVTLQCNQTTASYTSSTSTWWLDKLNNTTTTSVITYNATKHPLPVGASNPVGTLATAYLWNADRTLQSETVQSGVANQQRTTSYVYSNAPNYGLPTAVAVAASGDPNGSRSSGIAYSSDGYFPYVMSNALGQGSSVTTGARDGQPTLSVDQNGLRTLMYYDPFGQLIRTQFHGTTDSVSREPDRQMAVTWCRGCWGLSNAVSWTTEVQDGAPTHIVTSDLLGRTILDSSRQQDVSLSQVQTQYDALGRVQQQSTPYTTALAQFWTTYLYDSLGRVTQKIVPKGAEDGRGDLKTTYTYSGLQTAIQVCGTLDPDTSKCLNMTRTTDSLGRYMETVDAQGGVTQYWPDAGGHTLALKDAKGSITTAAYNAIGQRSSVSDPNQGAWSFAYNALGELLTQTDARGIVTSQAYDKLGRPLTRQVSMDITGDGVADAINDSWTYDTAAGNGTGKPATSQRTVNGAIERKQVFTYDTLARPIQTDTTQQIATGTTKNYTQTVAYDGYYGRPKSTGYPNGEAVGTHYSKYGHPTASLNPADGTIYRGVNQVDTRGQPIQAVLGNGTTDWRAYRPTTGEIIGIQLANSTTMANLRELDYHTDVFGNLTAQYLAGGSTAETYTYDTLQRMTSATRAGGATGAVSYSYDAAGNFTSKSDFSSTVANAYNYASPTCGGGPNAVKKVTLATGGTRNYCYDADGNLTSDSAGLSIKYDHDNLAYQTTRGASTINLAYGPDNQRTREWGSDGTKVYLDGGYEDWISAGSTKVYVGSEAEITNAGGTRTVNYLLTDRLGSVDAIANSTGTLIETRGSDAFGKPRSGTWADLSPARIQSMAITGHGFTGHEHLNSVELIHMNGRVYDYALGKFLSVDPFIQFPLNSQSLNPYSYILNNPLAGTDPTGYEACGRSCLVIKSQSAEVQLEEGSGKETMTTGSHIAGAMSTESLAATGSFSNLGFGAPSGGQKANGGVGGQGTNSTSTQTNQSTPVQNQPGFNPKSQNNGETSATSTGDNDNGATTYALGSGPPAEQLQLGPLEYPFSMTASPTEIAFNKDWEKWNGTFDKKLGKWVAKDDGVGNGTIGWGHNCGKCEDFKNGITREEGDALYEIDRRRFEKSINALRSPMHQQQFDGLFDFAFNVRSYAGSTLFKNVHSGTPVTEENFTAYGHAHVHGKLVEMPSLMLRRREEYGTYADGIYDSSH